MVALIRYGRVNVNVRFPPPGLAHSLKILTPFVDAIGWSMGVRNAKGIPNGFSLIGDRFTRNVVISFDTGKLLNSYRGQGIRKYFTIFFSLRRSGTSIFNIGSQTFLQDIVKVETFPSLCIFHFVVVETTLLHFI